MGVLVHAAPLLGLIVLIVLWHGLPTNDEPGRRSDA